MQEDRAVHLLGEDAALAAPLTALLKNYGIAVHAYCDAESFLRETALSLPASACVLCVETLPGMNGLSLLRRIRAAGLGIPVILMTERDDAAFNREALQLGATDVIERPLVKAFLTQRPLSCPLRDATPQDQKPRREAGILFRAITPDDADREQAFVRGLSERSKNLRFFSGMKQLSPKLLQQFTHPSFPGDYALIATSLDAGSERQIGVARYLPAGTPGLAEFAVVVADDWQGFGIATRLMHGIICVAAVAGVERLDGIVLRDNSRMLKLARKLGFTTLSSGDDPGTVRVTRYLYGAQRT